MLAKSSFGGLCGVVRGCARTLLGSTLFTYIIVYIYREREEKRERGTYIVGYIWEV
jgi:hypothetical protein